MRKRSNKFVKMLIYEDNYPYIRNCPLKFVFKRDYKGIFHLMEKQFTRKRIYLDLKFFIKGQKITGGNGKPPPQWVGGLRISFSLQNGFNYDVIKCNAMNMKHKTT